MKILSLFVELLEVNTEDDKQCSCDSGASSNVPTSSVQVSPTDLARKLKSDEYIAAHGHDCSRRFLTDEKVVSDVRSGGLVIGSG